MVPVEDPQGAPCSCCLPLQALQEVQQLYLLVTTIQDVTNLATGEAHPKNALGFFWASASMFHDEFVFYCLRRFP
jgi:hypothetical protein